MKQHSFRDRDELDQFVETTCDRAIDLMRDLCDESGQDLEIVSGLMLLPILKAIHKSSDNFDEVVNLAIHFVTAEPDHHSNVIPLFG